MESILVDESDDVLDQRSSKRRKADHFTFDRTINLGHVFTIITMIIGLVAVIRKIDEVQYKVDMMWNQFAKDHNICCPVRNEDRRQDEKELFNAGAIFYVAIREVERKG